MAHSLEELKRCLLPAMLVFASCLQLVALPSMPSFCMMIESMVLTKLFPESGAVQMSYCELQVSTLLQAEGRCTSEYVEYEGCGHVPMDEMPEKFLADLQRFVTDVASKQQPKPREDDLADTVDSTPLPLYPPSETDAVQD